MAREVINVGAAPNDGQGDPIRTSFIKTNNNFGELYARAQENPPGSLIGSVGDQAGMYAYDSHFFYYCYLDYDGSSEIWAEIPNTVIDAIEIANGTSNVSIPTANGNVLIGVANVANVAVFSSGGANFTSITASAAVINGDLTVTGNANLSGNIVGDRIVNGTTSIEIPVANGNATVSVAGTANVVVFTTSGLVANVISATGNMVGLNLTTAGVVSATGNVLGGNIITAANVQGGIVSASANLVGGNLVIPNGRRIRGDFSSSGVLGRSVLQTSNVSVNAPTIISAVPGENNANTLAAGFGAWNASNLANGAIFGVYSYSNQAALRSLSVGSASVNPITVLFGETEVARFTTAGNLGIGNTAPVHPLSVNGTAYISGDLTGAGNITAGGLFIGNGSALTGVIAVANVGAASQLTNGTTTLDIPVAGGNIIGNISGSTNLFQFSTVGFSAQGNVTAGNVNTAGVVTATGNITGGNVRTAGIVSATGNIIASGVFVGNGAGLTDVVGNIGSASQLTSGTTQINIPVASGNIVANVAGSTNLFEFSTVGFSALGNITGGNLVTAGLATLTGNVTAGNLRTGGVVSATGNVTGNYILGNGSQLSGIITSVANINSGTSIMEVVSSGGNIRTTIGAVANVLVIATSGAFVTGLHSVTGNITGGNIVTGGLVSATGNVEGDNITTSGTISAAGNVTAGNLSVNTGTVSVGAIVNNNANGVGNIGTTGLRFNTVFALASSAQYADLAEYYLADHAYPAGTVVAFGGPQELTICDQDHAVTVAGIISDRPAFEMNAGITGDHPVALALAGRVPCQVVGPVCRGQMLVAAGNGRARAEANPRMGAVIGKALEDFDGTTGRIEVVVGRI